jgi:hypothetical protein
MEFEPVGSLSQPNKKNIEQKYNPIIGREISMSWIWLKGRSVSGKTKFVETH